MARKSGFPWRAHRCWCFRMAVTTNGNGEPVCALHMDKPNYYHMACEEMSRIVDLVGCEEADRLQDLRFPGPLGTPIVNKDWYEWASETRQRLEAERNPDCKRLVVVGDRDGMLVDPSFAHVPTVAPAQGEVK